MRFKEWFVVNELLSVDQTPVDFEPHDYGGGVQMGKEFDTEDGTFVVIMKGSDIPSEYSRVFPDNRNLGEHEAMVDIILQKKKGPGISYSLQKKSKDPFKVYSKVASIVNSYIEQFKPMMLKFNAFEPEMEPIYNILYRKLLSKKYKLVPASGDDKELNYRYFMVSDAADKVDIGSRGEAEKSWGSDIEGIRKEKIRLKDFRKTVKPNLGDRFILTVHSNPTDPRLAQYVNAAYLAIFRSTLEKPSRLPGMSLNPGETCIIEFNMIPDSQSPVLVAFKDIVHHRISSESKPIYTNKPEDPGRVVGD